MESNFTFLRERFPVLARFGEQAERYFRSDANSCLMKLGMIGETIVHLIYDTDGIELPVPDDAVHRIRRLAHEDYIPRDIESILHTLRKKRNLAVHESYDSVEDARVLLPLAYTLAEWFYETYGDYRYEHHDFVPPEIIEARQTEAERAAEAKRDEEIAARASASARAEILSRTERQQRASRAAQHRHKSEAETRLLIDEQLRSVGWEADTRTLRYSRGTRPAKGRNLAIAEWPTATGPADYALFCGLRLVAIIEAKARHRDVASVLDGQAKRYAAAPLPEGLAADAQTPYGGEEPAAYRVPFIFATNGRPYLEQYKEKSGIWFQDLRDPMNIPHALRGWMSPDGLKDLLREDKKAAAKALAAEPYDELRDSAGLALRDYQIRAIEAAERAIAGGARSVLLALATGTGKTRLTLAMIYRFLKTGRFRRILFLVDRNVLGSQAEDTFREVKLAELQTLTQIYNVQGIADDAQPARETSLQIATVQSLVRRILYREEGPAPAVSDFDLVIIDEAHRGYLLDKDMTDDELLYRDQRDYLSKYRSVVDYFDAVKIALTATPALHTTQIFGAPVFTYSYREAVIDGYLVDHNAPIHIATELSESGIHYDRGDTPLLLDPETGEIENGAELADELDFDLGDFNRTIITEGFNRAVLEEIAKDFDPTTREQGKMLIFAENDQHADLIVRLLREIYEGQAPAAAIRKITGTIENGSQKKIREAVQHFKNEQYPSIVVTVDLLTTGVDVPEITALVFLRRVKSRILFEQMLGRATRLCPAIKKEAFDIYDPIGTYAALEKVSNMKPVAASPKETFGSLLDGLEEDALSGVGAGENGPGAGDGTQGGENSTARNGSESADAGGTPDRQDNTPVSTHDRTDGNGGTQSAAGRADETDARQKRLAARLGILTSRLRRKARLLTPAQGADAAAALRLPEPGNSSDAPSAAPPVPPVPAPADQTATPDARAATTPSPGNAPALPVVPATLADFIAAVQALPPERARAVLLANRAALEDLDRIHRTRKGAIVIDPRADRVTAVTRGYGEGETRPEDYLEAFTRWIRENRDQVEALHLACTSPRDLTRSELKSLRKQLSLAHFSERQLTEAYTGGTKGDLTADIISLIRRATIGAPLTSHEERIHRAIGRLITELRAEPGFTKMQENFLRKIEKYFLADENYVVSMQMFHDDPRFTRQGNIAHFDKLFGGRLAATIDKLSTYLYDDTDGGKLA